MKMLKTFTSILILTLVKLYIILGFYFFIIWQHQNYNELNLFSSSVDTHLSKENSFFKEYNSKLLHLFSFKQNNVNYNYLISIYILISILIISFLIMLIHFYIFNTHYYLNRISKLKWFTFSIPTLILLMIVDHLKIFNIPNIIKSMDNNVFNFISSIFIISIFIICSDGIFEKLISSNRKMIIQYHKEPFAIFAKSKGISLFKHAKYDFLLNYLQNIFIKVPILISSLIIIEKFFSIGGMGKYFLN